MGDQTRTGPDAEAGVGTTLLGKRDPQGITALGRRGRALIDHLVRGGRTRADVCVMSTGRDPFNAGTPANIRDAQWFADLYEEHIDPDTQVHLRRIHYAILGHAVLPNGEPYENTEACWNYIEASSKMARVLGYVDPRRIEDRRNPETEICWPMSPGVPEPSWCRLDDPQWDLPAAGLLALGDTEAPEVTVDGYEWVDADHPVQVELFIEKSTVNDVLVPLCRRLGVNLTAGAGYTSYARIVGMLDRAAASGRPLRVLCISDFDPAGHAMPVALARYMQYVIESEGLRLDVGVEPLALTSEQCVEYEFPRIPIKATDTRKASFEGRFGEGATESDALEGTHPGVLGELVAEAVMAFRDPGHADRLAAAEMNAQRALQAAVDRAGAHILDEVEAIHSSARDAITRLNEAIAPFVEAYNAEITPKQHRLAELTDEYIEVIDELVVPLPEREEATAEGLQTDFDWLYRSDREHFYQLQHFRYHQRREVME